jgi:hypothetical protein
VVTFTLREAELEQPNTFVTFQEYEVVVIGATTADEPFTAIGVQVLVNGAPLAAKPVKVAELPLQIAAGEALTVSEGKGFTTTAIVVELLQPNALVAKTVYVVFTAGVTETAAPLSAPGFQEYEVAPAAFKTAELPIQIAVGVALTVSVGKGFTITLSVNTLEHTPLEPVTV